MDQLYQKRKTKQMNHLMKYYRYVFNDHFTMILFFAFGGFLYFYSQMLKTMTAQMWSYIPIVLPFIYTAFLSVGHLATYLKEADEYYLLPKEQQMGPYLKKAFWHSLIFPTIILLFVLALSYPLLKGGTNLKTVDLLFLVLMSISGKGIFLLSDVNQGLRKPNLSKGLLYIFFLSGFFLSLWMNFILIGSLMVLFFIVFYKRTFRDLSFIQWRVFIERENQRMKRIYGFISLFTDVPEMPTQVKRRKAFDFLLKKIPLKQEKTYTYLYTRRLLRGQQFSSLFLSLTTFSLFILLILQNFIGNLLASMLFLYLLGFQLLPLYNSFEYMTLTQLYPFSKDLKKKDFQQILLSVLLVEGALFSLANFFVLSVSKSLLLLGILLLEIFLFCYIYTPKRLQRGKL